MAIDNLCIVGGELCQVVGEAILQNLYEDGDEYIAMLAVNKVECVGPGAIHRAWWIRREAVYIMPTSSINYKVSDWYRGVANGS